MPPNQGLSRLDELRLDLADTALQDDVSSNADTIRCAVLGCGMMGQEHISYISGYDDLRIDYLCDPHQPSLDKALQVMGEFGSLAKDNVTILHSEDELLRHADEIDLLVIASPNYLHTESLTKWGSHDLTILVEKPVAVSKEQHDMLREVSKQSDFVARIWVAMEYRYIPAISKLLSLLPQIGDIKMVTIRENRFPFLHKIGAWNRDPEKTGDSLVEKCCHFFDLFRLITGQEVSKKGIRALAQRGLNYQDEVIPHVSHPIIDSAYVMMPFKEPKLNDSDSPNDGDDHAKPSSGHSIMGCLELCMFSEGSRHQEEVIVTGTKGRLEAYLPENKVFFYQRPDATMWKDRSIPPPREAIKEQVFDCSDVKGIHGIDEDFKMPTHGGYHYSSTAVEWLKLISAIKEYRVRGSWEPEVSLEDGLRAVEMGMKATASIVNENRSDYRRAQSCPAS